MVGSTYSDFGLVHRTSAEAEKDVHVPQAQVEPKLGFSDRLILGLAIGGATVSKLFIAPGVSLGDLCFAAAVAISLGYLLLRRDAIQIPRWGIYPLLLLVWSLAGALI